LALGFLAGNTDAVRWVAYASLPIVVLLSLLSFVRLVEISIEDVLALRGINKIRAHYGGLVPEAIEATTAVSPSGGAPTRRGWRWPASCSRSSTSTR
jgi:hypothetical protein